MKEEFGKVFQIGKENPCVKGCTISKEIYNDINKIIYFSLAKNTDISAEIFPYFKLIIVNSGKLEIYSENFSYNLEEGDSFLTKLNKSTGFRTSFGTVYTEIEIRSNDFMNEVINAGEVFKLKDLVPYQDGKIVNMDICHNEKMKFVVMSFDKKTGLSEHAAPGDALIFALDGKGVIGYEGKEYEIEAGENFSFAKGGLHYVKAVDSKFKMALIITLE